MKKNHTIAPWFYNKHTNLIWSDTNKIEKYSGNDAVICKIEQKHVSSNEAAANAKLIAAAPDLLEALIRFNQEWVINGGPAQKANNYSIEQQINAAISKAIL